MTKAGTPHDIVESDQAYGCLALLKCANAPLTAIALARMLGLGGKHETKRRHVRAIIDVLRKQGCWIVATLESGYWLTMDVAIWKEWNEKRKTDVKKILAEAHRRTKMLADGRGQGLLFRMNARTGAG